MDINKKIKLLNFNLKKDLWYLLFWAYKSIYSWNWIDFVEHKEYVYWDPIKNIDWKTLWRSYKIYSKVFEEDRELNVLFFIDLSLTKYSWFFDKSKKDLLEEVFYWLSMACNQSWDNIWIYFYDWKKTLFITYKKWFTNIYKGLSIIDKGIIDSDYNVSDWLNEISRKNISNNLIFVLSDDIFTQDKDYIKTLSIRNEIIYINIFDYFENNLLNVDANINLSNNNSIVNIPLSDNSKIQKYREIRYKKIKQFNNFLRKYNIEYLYLDTKKDAFRELYLFFSKLKK